MNKKVVPKEYFGVLQIYGQVCEHDNVQIIGTRVALVALRDAINLVIDPANRGTTINTELAEFRTFASDGEGYTVDIQEADEQELDEMPVHYTRSWSD